MMVTSDRPNRATWLERQAERRRRVMDGLNAGLTMEKVAEANGISKQRVHQIKKKESKK
jgi:DNA-directed RNA polymerase sigma subunit (sigma70/sigma32)